MIRMPVIGYCCGIRSERQLCYEVSMNLAYRWFCKLKITDKVPDHSTLSKNRHGRFRESDLFRFVFEHERSVTSYSSVPGASRSSPTGECARNAEILHTPSSRVTTHVPRAFRVSSISFVFE
jgi:hypothetical protein